IFPRADGPLQPSLRQSSAVTASELSQRRQQGLRSKRQELRRAGPPAARAWTCRFSVYSVRLKGSPYKTKANFLQYLRFQRGFVPLTSGAMTLNHNSAGANGANLVHVADVHKHFTRGSERIDVLKGVDLQIPQGDFLALMGPSGSGKTTLLNLIGGLDAPTEGAVDVNGLRVSGLTGSRPSKWRSENIGFVFQLSNLLAKLTAERNVELPLLLTALSKKERRERVAVALKVVGLSDRAKHYPSQLSGGQEQRVGIARAIVTDPTLLLCDEPTGDLDRKAGDEILDLLQALNRDHGKTIIMVTHDPHAAGRARRTLHLEKGVLSGDQAS